MPSNKYRAPAALLILFIVLGIFPGHLRAASSWNPTLLVNTEAFQTIDSGDGSSDVEFRFGDNLDRRLFFDRDANRFILTHLLLVQGNLTATGSLSVKNAISGATLRIDGNSDIWGNLSTTGSIKTKSGAIINADNDTNDALLVFGNQTANQTLRYLHASQRFQFTTNLSVLGNLSGATLNVNSLRGCDTIDTDANGLMTCGTDGGGGGTFGTGNVLTLVGATAIASSTGSLKTNFGQQFLQSSTGSIKEYLRSLDENRYVNTTGDTMTGALNIQWKSSSSGQTLLNVRGGMSGRSLQVTGTGAGPLIFTDVSRGFVGVGTGAPQTKLEVAGTASGDTLFAQRELISSGSTVVSSGGILFRGTASTPTTPSSNRFVTFAKDYAGRLMFSGKDPAGNATTAYPFQPALYRETYLIAPAATTTVTAFGTTTTNSTTLSHPTPTEALPYATNFATSTTSGNESGLISVNTIAFRGSAAGFNGFYYFSRVIVIDTANVRLFSGLTSATSLANTFGSDNPAGNFAGYQFSTARVDTNWQFFTKDNTTQALANTGMAVTANNVYDMYFYVTPQGTVINWRIENLTAGTATSGATSSNLPTNSTAMRISIGVETQTTAARNFRMGRVYLEANR